MGAPGTDGDEGIIVLFCLLARPLIEAPLSPVPEPFVSVSFNPANRLLSPADGPDGARTPPGEFAVGVKAAGPVGAALRGPDGGAVLIVSSGICAIREGCTPAAIAGAGEEDAGPEGVADCAVLSNCALPLDGCCGGRLPAGD